MVDPRASQTVPSSGKSRKLVSYFIVILVIIVFAVSSVTLVGLYSTPSNSTTVSNQWIAQFMSSVNSARASNGFGPLQPAQNLSQFAVIRFQNLSTHYSFASYGFTNESVQFFGPQYKQVTENVVLPGTASPSVVASFLQKFESDKWNVFVNAGERHYGYFAGYALTYDITNGCGVIEAPPNVNTTQYLDSEGCTFTLKETQWLVFELST